MGSLALWARLGIEHICPGPKVLTAIGDQYAAIDVPCSGGAEEQTHGCNFLRGAKPVGGDVLYLLRLVIIEFGMVTSEL